MDSLKKEQMAVDVAKADTLSAVALCCVCFVIFFQTAAIISGNLVSNAALISMSWAVAFIAKVAETSCLRREIDKKTAAVAE